MHFLNSRAPRAICAAVILSLLSACGGAAASPSPSSSPSPSPSPEPVFAPGTTDNSEYKSEFLALTFSLPDGWVFGTEDELGEFFGLGSDIVESELDIGGGPEGSTFYEFFAYDALGGVSCAIMTAEDLSAHEGGKLITVRSFVDTLAQQYQNLSSREYSVGDSYRKTIAAREFIVLPLSVVESGLLQRNYVFRTGNYMVTLTFTAQTDEELDLLESSLQKLDTNQ